jgi:hypothetical protein
MTNTDKSIQFDKLNSLFQSLTTEQKQQELIILNCSNEIYNKFPTKVRVEFSNTHTSLFVESESVVDLVRPEKQGQLKVKPLMLGEYLKQITN